MTLPAQVNPGSVIVFSPRYFEEEQQIADQLLQGRVVIVDFKYLDDAIKQRMTAFLEGALFGIDGQKVPLREDLVALLPKGALYQEKKVYQPELYEKRILQL
jgi:cell division inhibitor SepF